MKYLLILLLIPMNLLSQESDSLKDNFEHFKGSYKSDFGCNNIDTRKVKKHLNNFPIGDYCGYMNVTLEADGNYDIHLECVTLEGDALIRKYYSFQGNYSIDRLGKLTLNGDHPFVSDTMEMKEYYRRKKGVRYLNNRNFSYRFNEQFTWITNKKRNTYCDGCELSPNE